MGHELISFCKSLQLMLCNGRVGSDINVGDLTCKNASIVDYVIVSPDLLNCLLSFHIFDFNELYSDVHCPLNVVFKISCDSDENCYDYKNREDSSCSEYAKWDASKAEELVNYIDDDKINSLDCTLNDLLCNINNVNLSHINEIVNETSNLMTESAKKLNIIKYKRNNSIFTQRKKNQPWFNAECKFKRKEFLHAKRRDFKGNQNIELKLERKKAAKIYKKTLKRCLRNYQSSIANNLRNIKATDPKLFWNYLKDRNHPFCYNNQPDCSAFAEMFKNFGHGVENLNCNSQNENINFLNFINIKTYYRDTTLLNNDITHSEVVEAICKLKNNKSHGLDNILNEFLKVVSGKLCVIFVKIFNLILKSGFIPTIWSLGIIQPIYKNKGNTNNPNNYRGITIYLVFESCLLMF